METKKIKSRSQLQEVWRRLKKNKGAMLGLFFLIALALIAISGGIVFDYETDVIGINPAQKLQGPSMQHLFGTDNLGRDIFARVMYGSRYSLAIGIGSVFIGLVIGIICGSLAGYYGGVVDQFIMRTNDILYAIPNIMIAVVIVSLFGTSTVNLLLALCVTVATAFTRIARAAVMTVKGQEYVEAAFAMGLPTWKVILKHILPNCLSPIIVQVTLSIGTTIIAASSLSFLGIGIPSPAPEWGAMLSEGRNYIRNSAYICVIPGLAIMFTVLALNLLGDGLRDALDPKLKK
ncbi:ABC transporter permease [Criibacterium bergeronii]|uniref:ABC transporter permease n=1 Tax=Criibacterium bergeronii TaxID=1871336 RepID=A0A371IMT5_9FIRM|nr:ABC transporter permease [Criibacterium bergeronii]MBS6063913.1 ABC transporter permease [Peptostreptococcaceae bacterium]RDY21797.1 ABC transporter permease [Criibacterium bergeronii]TRW24547.1 ABC transporter permease [Criibacterium bergeronii]